LVDCVLACDVNLTNQFLSDIDEPIFDSGKFVIHNRSRYLSFKDAIKLIMVLPGSFAKETHTKFADVITCYIVVYHTLIQETQANDHSQAGDCCLDCGQDLQAAV